MEYALIIILQLLGIGFHVMQKVIALGDTHKTKMKETFSIFWSEDWDTLFVSFLVMTLNVVAHFILESYAPKSIIEYEYYDLISFGIALTLGYAGQRIIYKYLGTAETALAKKGDQILNKI